MLRRDAAVGKGLLLGGRRLGDGVGGFDATIHADDLLHHRQSARPALRPAAQYARTQDDRQKMLGRSPATRGSMGIRRRAG